MTTTKVYVCFIVLFSLGLCDFKDPEGWRPAGFSFAAIVRAFVLPMLLCCRFQEQSQSIVFGAIGVAFVQKAARSGLWMPQEGV